MCTQSTPKHTKTPVFVLVTVTVVCQNDDRGNYQLFSSYCSIVWTVQIKQDSRFSINRRDDISRQTSNHTHPYINILSVITTSVFLTMTKKSLFALWVSKKSMPHIACFTWNWRCYWRCAGWRGTGGSEVFLAKWPIV